jgi:hypothetical protein
MMGLLGDLPVKLSGLDATNLLYSSRWVDAETCTRIRQDTI